MTSDILCADILCAAVFLVLLLCRVILLRNIAALQQEHNSFVQQRLHIFRPIRKNSVSPAVRKDRAEAYLHRIVAVTGSEQMHNYCVLDVGKASFHVYDAHIVRGKDPTGAYEQTCFYVAEQGMPAAERIATALLQLKNNPELFDRWAARRASFKPDGRMFKLAGQ